MIKEITERMRSDLLSQNESFTYTLRHNPISGETITSQYKRTSNTYTQTFVGGTAKTVTTEEGIHFEYDGSNTFVVTNRNTSNYQYAPFDVTYSADLPVYGIESDKSLVEIKEIIKRKVVTLSQESSHTIQANRWGTVKYVSSEYDYANAVGVLYISIPANSDVTNLVVRNYAMMDGYVNVNFWNMSSADITLNHSTIKVAQLSIG